MYPSLLLPNLNLTIFILSLILFNTFLPFSFAYSKDIHRPEFLPTEGTQTIFPFINLLKESLHSNYTGDSYSIPDNMDLANLLDIGALRNINTNHFDKGVIPPLDGTLLGDKTQLLDHYSMKFVAYDMRLGKLQTVNALDMSFTVQLQIFMQWEEWLLSNSFDEVNWNCTYVCDNTRPMDHMCCDRVWVPTLRLPNADVTRMDSILSYGNLAAYYTLFGDNCTNLTNNQTEDELYYSFVNASCYHQRFWELLVDATCDSNMSFKKFPSDVQELSIDIRNPYASRTWFQLAPGSLKQKANNLVQQISADAASLGWRITDLIVSPLCDVLSWNHTFLALDAYLFSNRMNESQSKDIDIHLLKSCPKLYSWFPDDTNVDLTAESIDTSAYDSIRKNYAKRLNYTKTMYIKCVTEHGSLYKGGEIGNYIDFWINASDPYFNNKMSLPCLVDAVRNLTTPGIKVTILVKRYTDYYVLKLVIPMIVCVGFAFTAVAINVKGVANRLMVVVPAAISLTALQVTVVATDIPAVSYIVPSTWLMILSYLIQLLISLESMVVYKMGYVSI